MGGSDHWNGLHAPIPQLHRMDVPAQDTAVRRWRVRLVAESARHQPLDVEMSFLVHEAIGIDPPGANRCNGSARVV